jgi:hypothetical protein
MSDKININRLTMFFASSGMSDEHVLDLLRQLHTLTPDEIILRIHLDRDYLNSSLQQSRSMLDLGTDAVRSSAGFDSDALKQVERLLVVEARLQKLDAAELLAAELLRRNRSVSIPTFNPKEGFAKWLRQVSSSFPLAEILHVAAALRNRRVHSAGDDWIEKGGSK